MGTSHSGKELAGKITAAGYTIGRANRQAVSAAALVYKDRALMSAQAATGDGRLSHWGWRSQGGGYRTVKLGAGYDVKGYDHAVAKVAPRPQGPWKVMEYGAGAHTITPRRRRKNGRMVFTVGDKTVGARNVNHPGTAGKGIWSRAVAAATSPAKAVFAARHRRALAESFK